MDAQASADRDFVSAWFDEKLKEAQLSESILRIIQAGHNVGRAESAVVTLLVKESEKQEAANVSN